MQTLGQEGYYFFLFGLSTTSFGDADSDFLSKYKICLISEKKAASAMKNQYSYCYRE